MFERFTTDARAVVITTQGLAPELGVEEVGPVHLLLALTHEGSAARRVLAAHGVTEPEVAAALGLERDAAHRPMSRSTPRTPRRCCPSASTSTPSAGPSRRASARAPSTRRRSRRTRLRTTRRPWSTARPRGRVRFGPGRVRFGRGAKKVLELAVREAVRARSRDIRSEHIALGVLRCDDADVRRVLWELSVDERALRVDLEGRMRRSA